MTDPQALTRRILIISANPLFREGLLRLYAERWGEKSASVRLLTTLKEALPALETCPDLVIVDYDDTTIQREIFMKSFLAGESPMQVMLVSLQESGQVVVYDRRTMTFAQAEHFLSDPWEE